MLRPGGRFAFPLVAPPRPGSRICWTRLGFDAVMRVRDAVRRPPFVMYCRTFGLGRVRREPERAGFAVELPACRRPGTGGTGALGSGR
ncbi:hypothetical protein SGLAU_03250 [Streptomyces glaucescens]|uniref:Uncharacterized protein n=1 Tax=Streptomyces glaucescens TaxID=1907 RepID=A0A089X0V2_STRGA|nr:hypothetical protein SGLAU_03250 [Streptomyces glaucescens]